MGLVPQMLPLAHLVSLLVVCGFGQPRATEGSIESSLGVSETSHGVAGDDLPAELPMDKLYQLLALELHTEGNRPAERMLNFNDFQDTLDLDCQARLLQLLNRTAETRQHIAVYHNDVVSVASLYVQILKQSPVEISWVWLILSSHNRVLLLVHGYFAKLVVLALDKHLCLMTNVRKVVLDAVVHWKKLHTESVELLWHGFAFGALTNDIVSREPDIVSAKDKGELGRFPNETWYENLLSANAWMSNVREWFEQLAQNLYDAMVIELPHVAAGDADAATRMHHQDEEGMFVPYEYLRRKVFGQWALDKGLLRGLLRHVWQPDYGNSVRISIADFGAGGGQYSTWLNETGLVYGYAFDGTQQATAITRGVVQEINLIQDVQLWRTFDWVMCLEVGEHIPAQYSGVLLRNLKRHAEKGLIISWSSDWEGIGHVNCLSQDEFVATVVRETGFIFDGGTTEVIKQSCEIEYIARTVAVFRAPA